MIPPLQLAPYIFITFTLPAFLEHWVTFEFYEVPYEFVKELTF